MKSLKIHIVGGTGQMGTWLKNYLESENIFVSASGRNGDTGENLKKADIIFISVPISFAGSVIEKSSKLVKKGALLADLSSVRSEVDQALKKTKLPSLGVHFLFGPTVTSIQNQKIIFCPIKNNQHIPFLKKLFNSSGAQVIEMSSGEHDYIMAHIQGLVHFANLVLGKVLIKGKIDISGKLSTPVFLAQAATIGRVLSQPPKLLAEIQLGNPKYLEVLEAFNKEGQKLINLIKENNHQKLEQELSKIHLNLEATPRGNKETKVQKTENRSLPGKNLKVAYLGPEGTFSQQAVMSLKGSSKNILVPCKTIYDVFEAVSSGSVDFGLVPAENSTEGTVRETLDYLIDFDLKVNLAFDLVIHQNLLAKSPKLENIKRVVSHPQGIAQVREWLRTNLPQAKIETAPSTVAAATQLGDKGLAMIGSEVAAKIYGLNILAKNIEDNENNITRFYVISKKQQLLNPDSCKTLLFLTVFNRVGILRDILDVFARNNINLSKLESRPSREKMWDYHFFIEVESNMNDLHVGQALNILKQYCPVIKVLGGE